MKLPAPIVARPRAARTRSPQAVLGPDHPLVRTIEARDAVMRQLLAVGAMLVGSLIALAERAHWAGALAASAGAVLLGLAFVLAALEQDKRGHARDLILKGHGTLPLAPVEHEGRRLLARRTRNALAGTLEWMCREASRPTAARRRPPCLLFEVRVVSAVAPELRQVAGLLRADRIPARGVALVDWLVTGGCSPLYGHSVDELRDALRRVQQQV